MYHSLYKYPAFELIDKSEFQLYAQRTANLKIEISLTMFMADHPMSDEPK
jgi:hypothetical protein